MTQLISKFFVKKQPVQVDDSHARAEAALQQRVSRMVQHHIAVSDVSASSQMLRNA